MKPALWKIEKEELHAPCVIFDVYKEAACHPLDKRAGTFYVAHAPDWVTAVPVTRDGHILLVNQYRFGVRKLSWEFPGGVIDNGEDFLQAAEREVLEETGYSGKATPLGNVSSNPAIFNNRCHFVLIEDCVRTAETHFDANEEIETRLCSPAEVLEMASNGKMHHALMLSALAKTLLQKPEIFSIADRGK